VRDPHDLRELGRLSVRDRGWPTAGLNDLETVGDHLYANIYGCDLLARISRRTGRVTGIVDATALLEPEVRAAVGVLNGIAHDPTTGRLLLSGKGWPFLFEVELEEDPA
jgi:glutamine cyclotransferase